MSVAKDVNKVALSSVQNAADLTKGMTGQNLGGQYQPFLTSQRNDLVSAATNYMRPLTQDYQSLINLANANQGSGKRLVQGAQTAAGYGSTTAANAMGMQNALMPYAQQLLGYGKSLLPYGQQLFSQGQNLFAHEQPLFEEGNRIAEMGFDPQSALYARTLQQIQDQQRAGQAARGLGASPYGAGLEGDATRNFNIDWQNQQLGRAIQAGQAQQGLYGQAGQLAQQGGALYGQGAEMGKAASDIGQGAAAVDTSAFNLGSGATDLAARAAALPYTAFQSLANDRLNAQRGQYDTRTGLIQDKVNATTNLGGQTQALNQPRQQVISDYLAAAGLGPGYTQAASGQQNANTNMFGTLLHLVGK